MVAIALNTELHLKTASHARGQDRTCVSRTSSLTNSASRANLREAVYVGSDRLGTCSNDPIGYRAHLNLYFYDAMSRDPLGTSPLDDDEGKDDKLSCEEFLATLGPRTPDEHWPSKAKDQYNRQAHIFCGNCNFTGESHKDGLQCHVCLKSGVNASESSWTWLLIHELIHCKQYGCGRKSEGPWIGGDPYSPPKDDRDPNAPPDPKDCKNCLDFEQQAYESQCRMQYPGDRKAQKACVDSGKCYSCGHRCKGLGGFDKDCKDTPKIEF